MKQEHKEEIKLKGETLKNIKQAYQLSKENKKNFIYYIIGTVFVCIIGAIAPLFTAQQILNLSNGIWEQLFWATIAVFGLEILRNTLNYLNGVNGDIFFRTTLKNIQLKISDEILKTKTNELNKKSSGYYIERISGDSGRISEIFLDINDYLTLIVTNIGILISIFVLNKIIFIFYVFFLIILYMVQWRRNETYQKNDQQYRKLKEKSVSLTTELVRGARDIKVLNAEESFINEAKTRIANTQMKRYQMHKTNRRYHYFYNNLRDILDFSYILLTIYLITHNMLIISTAIILFNYRNQIVYTLDYVGRLMEEIKNFNLSAGRVFQIIDSDKKETFGEKHIDKIHGDFAFEHVNFSYEPEEPILKDITFQVKANETVSFVGRSGSGKSTIFNLLTKLYEPTSGKITIDGIDILELDKDSIRGNISIISQSPYIFNMSIRENLTIIKEGLTEEEMIKACKTACLHDYIMTLPNQYDTVIGEGGVSLSGGQRQRLAIARALVQKTEIILFDEATSALDNETQRDIQTSIENMQGEYTILIIAHRLSTVINSDRLVLIENGKIEAEGTHKELLKNNKTYQSLYDLELKEAQEK